MQMAERSATVTWPTWLFMAWVVLTVLFTTLSPSASVGMSAPLRLVFWAAHVGLALAILQIAQNVVQRIGPDMPPWIEVAASGLVGALAFLPVALGLDLIFPEDDAEDIGWVAQISSEAASIVPPILITWLALNAPRLLSLKAPSIPKAEKALDDVRARLPAAIGTELVSLSAELHYLRVRTRLADALILYPFGRAVDALSGYDGQQVHTSHWVALQHVERIERRGEGAVAHMSDGNAIPVSRRYRRDLEAAIVTGAGTAVTRA